MAHVHFEMCYVLLKAALDLTTCLCECERPIDGEQYLRMQTSEAPASGVCDGAEVADKVNSLCAIALCRGQALSHTVICAQREC